MITNIPIGLKTALESSDCVLFIGAGIGAHMLGPNNTPAPDGVTLARELAAEFEVDTKVEILSKVAEVVEGRRGRAALEEFVRKRLSNVQPDQNLKWLLSRRWQAIFTTNYDSCIERAYELNAKPLQRAVTISATHELVHYDPRLDVPIYHLHGALFGRRGGIVITETDYITYRDRRRMLFELLKTKFATSTFLYVGYSHQDPNWRQIWAELVEEFLPSTPPVSYRVAPGTDPLDVEILKGKSLETLDTSFAEFCAVASSTISELDANVDLYKSIRSQVPSQLLAVFETNSASIARLLASWTFVNQAPFTEKPNVGSFLWGDRPNWALIASKDYFLRDIEEELCDELLDILTGSPTSPAVLLTLGAAGYGVTTVLMSVAVRLVQEGATTVFMHRPGSPLNEGDIVFAASLAEKTQPSLFFIDDAADNLGAIQGAIAVLRSEKKAAILVLGERLNEWRQRGACQ